MVKLKWLIIKIKMVELKCIVKALLIEQLTYVVFDI